MLWLHLVLETTLPTGGGCWGATQAEEVQRPLWEAEEPGLPRSMGLGLCLQNHCKCFWTLRLSLIPQSVGALEDTGRRGEETKEPRSEQSAVHLDQVRSPLFPGHFNSEQTNWGAAHNSLGTMWATGAENLNPRLWSRTCPLGVKDTSAAGLDLRAATCRTPRRPSHLSTLLYIRHHVWNHRQWKP